MRGIGLKKADMLEAQKDAAIAMFTFIVKKHGVHAVEPNYGQNEKQNNTSQILKLLY